MMPGPPGATAAMKVRSARQNPLYTAGDSGRDAAYVRTHAAASCPASTSGSVYPRRNHCLPSGDDHTWEMSPPVATIRPFDARETTCTPPELVRLASGPIAGLGGSFSHVAPSSEVHTVAT